MENSIGTLSEKSIHSIIKDYLQPDKNKQEVKVGKYIADIKDNNKIIEIQTQQFKKLLPKLDYYTKLGLEVTVVYPIIHKKVINWINPESMEVEEIRKSSHIGVIQDCFKELYWIIDYIAKEKIIFEIMLIDANEYKYLDGRGQSSKIKATKIDKVPTSIVETIQFKSISDLKKFIPDTLPELWTSKEFIKCTKCNKRWAGSGLKMLRDYNIISIIGKQGNSYIYKLNKE